MGNLGVSLEELFNKFLTDRRTNNIQFFGESLYKKMPLKDSYYRNKLEDEEEIVMESDEEGLLATNLIEELSGNDLGFQLRQGDMLLNNSQYFQITNLTRLQKIMNDDDDDDKDPLSPRLKFKVRRKSTGAVR